MTPEIIPLKILIADDEEGLRLSMAGILEFEGFAVSTAADGYQAIEMVKKDFFDVAFIDIRMPGINGVDTFKQIKQISPRTIVVMMTAFAMNELIKDSIAHGAYACLSKPFNMDRIIEILNDVSRKSLVFVIDDDPSLAQSVTDRLKSGGFNVLTGPAASEGLQLVRRRLPGALIIDGRSVTGSLAEYLKTLAGLYGMEPPRIVLLNAERSVLDPGDPLSHALTETLSSPVSPDKASAVLAAIPEARENGVALIGINDKDAGVLEKAVTAAGIPVFLTAQPGDAQERMRREVFKIVVLNGPQPGVNGLDVYAKAKEINADVSVVFISEPLESGASSSASHYTYLQKPFDPEKLINMIEAINNHRRTGTP